MRVLVLLQGIPGSGKSTHIRQMGWEPHTLSPDTFRLMHGSPVITEDGTFVIDQKLSGKAFSMLFEVLEGRMKNGEFTVVDATHCNKDVLNKYRGLSDKYRYRVYILRFDTAIEDAVRQDRMRPQYKQVGEAVIKRMYEQLQGCKAGWAETYRYDDQTFYDTKLKWMPENLNLTTLNGNCYEKIVHFGDLQGCAEPLKEYFATNPFNNNYLYVFVGDFVDRGIQNAEVIKMMLELYKRRNVVMVEGNHEHHLNCWANDLPIASEEFELRTKPQLESALTDKKAVRELYRRTRQILYYEFDGKFVFVTHGGVPMIPDPKKIVAISTRQYIKGVGRYEIDIDEIFEQNTRECDFQVHGHRNAHMRPLETGQRSFNLEGGVEFGGYFRVAELSKQGWTLLAIQNKVFDIHQERGHHPNLEPNEVNMLTLLRGNKHISEKKMGNDVSSFNFDRDTFYEGLWNAQSVKARGLFINTKANKIVARSYEKFFNVNEMEATKIDRLKADFAYPVKFFKKENGFLGILGYDEASDELIIASKSSTKSDFAGYFKELLMHYVDLNELKEWIKDKNFSLVFEVVDIERDPHIIEYTESKLILLDIVYNQIKFERAMDEYRNVVARYWGFEAKQEINEVHNADELMRYMDEIDRDDNHALEGYVLEDSKGFMTKIKLPHYQFWKYMRGTKERMYLKPNQIPVMEDPIAHAFVQYLLSLPHDDLKRDIISLRKEFCEGTTKT